MTKHPDPTALTYPAWHETVVRHADLDPNDHVTNSVICSWFDDGRYILLRQHLRPLVEPDDYFALAHLEMNFSREVRMFEAPRIGTGLVRLGRSSIAMRQHLLVDGEVAAIANSVTVLADGRLRRAKALSDTQRQALAAFLLAAG